MRKLLGTIVFTVLVLTVCSPSRAQFNVMPGRAWTPAVTFGEPAYSQYPYAVGQPAYGWTYHQPAYAPRYYSSGYAVPGIVYTRSYHQPSAAAPSHWPGYQAPIYFNGYSTYGPPVYSATGLIINGHIATMPH